MSSTGLLTGTDEMDPADTAEPTDAAPAEPAGTPGTGRWRRPARVAGFVALLAVSAGAAGVFGWQYYRTQHITNAAHAALETARNYAVTLTSVDTNNLDANFAAVLDGATGEFQDMYAKSSSELRQLLIEHRAAGHGVVIESGIKSADLDEVVVLLFVDQTVSNTSVPDARIDRSRIVMTMQPVDGRWKAAKVELP